MKKSTLSVDAYIVSFPKDIQEILGNIRQTIKKAAPQAVEEIAYQMPAYKLNKKPLVYFAAFKNHIGFYATPTGHQVLLTNFPNINRERDRFSFR